MQHVKAQIYAHMIVNKTNFKKWADARNYKSNTVRKVVARFDPEKGFTKGSESEKIISELLEMIGEKPRTIN